MKGEPGPGESHQKNSPGAHPDSGAAGTDGTQGVERGTQTQAASQARAAESAPAPSFRAVGNAPNPTTLFGPKSATGVVRANRAGGAKLLKSRRM
jgi:hypothetical protein